MSKQKLDLSVKSNALGSMNATAITGQMIMNTVIAQAYLIELIKGVRSPLSYADGIYGCNLLISLSSWGILINIVIIVKKAMAKELTGKELTEAMKTDTRLCCGCLFF